MRGLALAFALAYIVGSAAALAHLRRRLTGVDGGTVARSWLRVGVASSAMAAAVLAVTRVAEGDAADVGVGVIVGVTVYAVAAKSLGIEELATLLRIRRRPA